MTEEPRRSHPVFRRLLPLLLLLPAAASCAPGIDMVQYTGAVYPPKASPNDVQILEEMPSAPHARIALITIAESKKSLGVLQRSIMNKAAELGADAVVFGDPESSFRTDVSYAPVYRPWGYYSPYYGWYGGGYRDAVPRAYKVRYNTLAGLAIRYQDTGGSRVR